MRGRKSMDFAVMGVRSFVVGGRLFAVGVAGCEDSGRLIGGFAIRGDVGQNMGEMWLVLRRGAESRVNAMKRRELAMLYHVGILSVLRRYGFGVWRG